MVEKEKKIFRFIREVERLSFSSQLFPIDFSEFLVILIIIRRWVTFYIPIFFCFAKASYFCPESSRSTAGWHPILLDSFGILMDSNFSKSDKWKIFGWHLYPSFWNSKLSRIFRLLKKSLWYLLKFIIWSIYYKILCKVGDLLIFYWFFILNYYIVFTLKWINQLFIINF